MPTIAALHHSSGCSTPDGKKTLLVCPCHTTISTGSANTISSEPVKIAAGSKLLAIYTYDNSVSNPANPDHNRIVPWGDQSFDEMLYTAFHYAWVGETSDKMDHYAAYDQQMNDTRLFGMLDTKINGKLDPSELVGPIGKQFAANFAKIDADHDGFIEPQELMAAQAAAQKRRQQASQQPQRSSKAKAPPARPRRRRHRRKRLEADSNSLCDGPCISFDPIKGRTRAAFHGPLRCSWLSRRV